MTPSPVLSLACPGEAFSDMCWLTVTDGLDDLAGHRERCGGMCRESVRFGNELSLGLRSNSFNIDSANIHVRALCAKSCIVRPRVGHLTSLSPSFLFC